MRLNKQKLLLDYLKSNRLMTLGTVYKNKPWSATVFFAYNKKPDIFFYSSSKTKHCLNISKNPNVSVVINHDWRDKEGNIRGLQAIGIASRVTKKNYAEEYSIYSSRFKWADDFKKDHFLYKIKLSGVWYINEKEFGHFHRVKIR